MTDRYTKAIEQLGSKELDVRIGGIYALERIARDSARDHPTVMEVLTAFVREHSREQWPPSDPGGQEQERSTRPDVQAAVTAVARRDGKRDIRSIDLTGVILIGADLTCAIDAGTTGADLIGADLYGADLTGAQLDGANLLGATLIGAHLTRAYLTFADLTQANLRGAQLDGAHLDGARWPKNAPVPAGWKLDTSSGRLERAGTDSGPVEAN